ncbi:MAG: hypothetical protein IPK77_12810 [Cellvibrio sp.]|nr:hypothetical protein [Cellvibrio sp.]
MTNSKPIWHRIIVVNVDRDLYLRTFSFYLNIVPLLYLKIFTLLEKGGIDVVAMGDFRSRLWGVIYRFFMGKRLWLLDDGIALLNFYRHEQGRLIMDPALLEREYMQIGRTYLKKNSEGRIVFKTFLTVDTVHPFSSERVDLTKTFAFAKSSSQGIDHNLVFFVGAKLIEEKIMSSNDYMNICAEVARHLPNKKIIYFPHREESNESVTNIKEFMGFEIVRPDLPLEFYVCDQRVLPGSLVGFSSAAICTIADIYPSLDVHLIELNSLNLDAEMREVFDVCHAYIKSLSNVVSIIRI